MNQLQTTTDEFGGVIIESDSLPELPDEFELFLEYNQGAAENRALV